MMKDATTISLAFSTSPILASVVDIMVLKEYYATIYLTLLTSLILNSMVDVAIMTETFLTQQQKNLIYI
jgi:hypothetical protein